MSTTTREQVGVVIYQPLTNEIVSKPYQRQGNAQAIVNDWIRRQERRLSWDKAAEKNIANLKKLVFLPVFVELPNDQS